MPFTVLILRVSVWVSQKWSLSISAWGMFAKLLGVRPASCVYACTQVGEQWVRCGVEWRKSYPFLGGFFVAMAPFYSQDNPERSQ